MKWCKIEVETNSQTADLVSDIMFELGMDGVEITDRNNLSFLASDSKRWDYVDDEFVKNYPDKVTAKGMVSPNLCESIVEQLREKLNECKELFTLDFGSLNITVNSVDDKGWADGWKKYYKPFAIDNVMIVPKWESSTSKKIKVILDPGIAFGTGNHATTAGCIKLMQKIEVKNKKILDMGCGSGILGITALKLGASHCDFCDISQDAYKMTKENAGYNNIPLNYMEVFLGDILTDCNLRMKLESKKYDIVLANLTAGILSEFCNFFKKALKNSGFLIASGIIAERKQEIAQKYSSSGFIIKESFEKDGWVSFLFKAD